MEFLIDSEGLADRHVDSLRGSIRKFIVLIPAVALTACAGIDLDTGKALGSAGQAAAQAMADQATAATKTLGALPEWYAVGGALVCANTSGQNRAICLANARAAAAHPDSALSDAQKKIIAVMQARADAATALLNAYQSFTNLATYDAGAETQTAIANAVGAINNLTKAAATIAPQGVALSAISSTFTTIAENIGGIIASERQRKLLLAASKDLHKATDAMIAALTVERDKLASESLLSVLVLERATLYGNFVQAGLVSPRDALSPLFSDVAPSGAQLSQSTPAGNADVLATASTIDITQRAIRQQAQVIASYDAALAAFKALSASHSELENQQSVDLTDVLAQAQRVEIILRSLFSK